MNAKDENWDTLERLLGTQIPGRDAGEIAELTLADQSNTLSETERERLAELRVQYGKQLLALGSQASETSWQKFEPLLAELTPTDRAVLEKLTAQYDGNTQPISRVNLAEELKVSEGTILKSMRNIRLVAPRCGFKVVTIPGQGYHLVEAQGR